MHQAAERFDDPILEVVGISKDEILRRCSEIRRGARNGGRLRRPGATVGVTSGGWRLLDFADLSDEDFVREAHRILLGRTASPFDLERRLRELRAGSSRMQIVVRLALSPEGRRAVHPRVRGIGLRTLLGVGQAIEAARTNVALGPAVTRSERTARRLFSRARSRGNGALRR
jgi:hypothetical protein